MGSPVIVALLALVVVAYASKMALVYIRMRGPRLIVCPENHRPAAVRVDAGHSAVAAVVGSPEIRLESCSRWPEREGCNQACCSQIAAEPRATLAAERVRTWIADQTCALCGRRFDPWHAVGPQPGLRSAETQRSTRWDDIPAADLAARLATDAPVCKHCQLLEDFGRRYPDMVLDRHR